MLVTFLGLLLLLATAGYIREVGQRAQTEAYLSSLIQQLQTCRACNGKLERQLRDRDAKPPGSK